MGFLRMYSKNLAVTFCSAFSGFDLDASGLASLGPAGLAVGAAKQQGVTVISHSDLLLLDKEGSWPSLCPEVMLQLGGRITSKLMSQFMDWSSSQR